MELRLQVGEGLLRISVINNEFINLKREAKSALLLIWMTKGFAHCQISMSMLGNVGLHPGNVIKHTHGTS